MSFHNNYFLARDAFKMHFEYDKQGKIIRKIEHVAGKNPRELYYAYTGGKLQTVRTGADHFAPALEIYQYNARDQREESWHYGAGTEQNHLKYYYVGDRLQGVNNEVIFRDTNGFRRERVLGDEILERYFYAPDYRLLRVEKSGITIDFEHDENGQRKAKFINGQCVESYKWHDLTRMDSCNIQGILLDFLYISDNDRLPSMMLYGDDFYHLLYDQVGSLRVLADDDGNVVKEILYDSFGRILEDTKPEMLVPLGFGGGLHDRDTGWVRMGYRDYDPETGRFTALDPLGYAGGDSDLYGYCLDDPVNLIDPEGLRAGFWSTISDWLVPPAEAATLVTDMDNNTTTFDPRPEDPDGKPFTIETRNKIISSSAPGADDPFETEDVNVIDTVTNHKSFGPDGAYIDTGDPRGRDIHGGGGANEKEAIKARQGWRPTFGCTRGQNKDVIKLADEIRKFQQRHPAAKIPYSRQ